MQIVCKSTICSEENNSQKFHYAAFKTYDKLSEVIGDNL